MLINNGGKKTNFNKTNTPLDIRTQKHKNKECYGNLLILDEVTDFQDKDSSSSKSEDQLGSISDENEDISEYLEVSKQTLNNNSRLNSNKLNAKLEVKKPEDKMKYSRFSYGKLSDTKIKGMFQEYEHKIEKSPNSHNLISKIKNNESLMKNLISMKNKLFEYLHDKRKERKIKQKYILDQAMKQSKIMACSDVMKKQNMKKKRKHTKNKNKLNTKIIKLKPTINFLDLKEYSFPNERQNNYDWKNWKIMLADGLKTILSCDRNINNDLVNQKIRSKLENVPFLKISGNLDIKNNLSKLETLGGKIYEEQTKKYQSLLLNYTTTISLAPKEKDVDYCYKKEQNKIKINELKSKLKKIENSNLLSNVEAIEQNCPNDNYVSQRKLIKPTISEEQSVIKMKQRIINFSAKLYNENLDLSKILKFWYVKRAEVKIFKLLKNRSGRTYLSAENKKRETEENEKKKHVEEDKKKSKEKRTKGQVHVKQNYEKPKEDLLKLIPFCNNIYKIQKNES